MLGPAPPGGLRRRSRAVQLLRRLGRSRAAREDQRAFLVEGPEMIREALAAGSGLEAVYVDRERVGTSLYVKALYEEARAAGVTCLELAPGVVDTVATTRSPQGLVAVAPFCDVSLESLDRGSFVVVCAGVSDPGNLGTILRGAAASGSGGVVCCGGAVDPYNPKAVRASAGAVFRVPLVRSGDAVALVAELGSMGLRCLAAAPRGGARLDESDLTGGVAVLVGHEASGVAPAVLDAVDGLVSIPLSGPMESLNAAMAATVVCFEAQGQRGRAEERH